MRRTVGRPRRKLEVHPLALTDDVVERHVRDPVRLQGDHVSPQAPSAAASAAATPNRVASTRSNAVGVPPRCTWPRIVTRVSMPVRPSISEATTFEMPPRRWWPNRSTSSLGHFERALGGHRTLGDHHDRGVVMPAWRRSSASHTSSMSNGSSGIRVIVAPPAMPADTAMWPTWRPMTSTTITRSWDSAVVWSRSIAADAICTAVSNPKVISVPAMSLSMVLGTPMQGTPSSCRSRATPSEPSPPMAMIASMSWRADGRLDPVHTVGDLVGLVRDVPRIVPPRGRMPRTGRRRGPPRRRRSRPATRRGSRSPRRRAPARPCAPRRGSPRSVPGSRHLRSAPRFAPRHPNDARRRPMAPPSIRHRALTQRPRTP